MLTTGRLPSSFNLDFSEHPSNQGYLYFVPGRASFVNHPLYQKIKIELDGGKLEDAVHHYAADIQRRRFMNDTLGYWSANRGPDEFEVWYLADLAREGVNIKKIKKIGIVKLYKELDRRRSVCIGINNKAFELGIEEGNLPEEEVKIFLPNGLDIKYV